MDDAIQLAQYFLEKRQEKTIANTQPFGVQSVNRGIGFVQITKAIAALAAFLAALTTIVDYLSK